MVQVNLYVPVIKSTCYCGAYRDLLEKKIRMDNSISIETEE